VEEEVRRPSIEPLLIYRRVLYNPDVSDVAQVKSLIELGYEESSLELAIFNDYRLSSE
jgi:hypothetical protein